MFYKFGLLKIHKIFTSSVIVTSCNYVTESADLLKNDETLIGARSLGFTPGKSNSAQSCLK